MFQAVFIRVLHHRAKSFKTCCAIVLGLGERRTAVASQFGQESSGIPFAIHAACIGQHREFRDTVTEPQSEVTVLVVAAAIKPISHYLDVDIPRISNLISTPALPYPQVQVAKIARTVTAQ